MEQIISLLESQYVDSVDQTEVEETAIRKFLSSFDPHSVYIPPQYVSMANQDLKGGFDGVGIEFFMRNDTPYVVRVIENGPSRKAGVRAGDRMLYADSFSLIGLKNMEVVSKLKGDKNTEVLVRMYRPGDPTFKSVKLKRASIVQESVRSMKLEGGTAYFRIMHFAEPTHREFVEQFEAISKTQDVKQVIIDLRDNPGGYLKTAIDLLDEFVDSKQLLAYTRGQKENQKTFYANKGGICADVKLICLVNESSASASEIFSGAIQDLDRGLVIGSRTFGKGLVQETFQLSDGSQVRLTVSRYYIPSGRSIQKPYDEEGYELEDSVANATTEKFSTKSGRKVQAGGGILPDVIMRSDSAVKTDEEVSEAAAGVIDDFISNRLLDKPISAGKLLSTKRVQDIIGQHAIGGIEKSDIEHRVIYQLFGPQALMEEVIKRDDWVMLAMKRFDQLESLLNP